MRMRFTWAVLFLCGLLLGVMSPPSLQADEPRDDFKDGIVIGRAIASTDTANMCLAFLAWLDTREEDVDTILFRRELEAYLLSTTGYIHRAVTLKGRPELNVESGERALRRTAEYFFRERPEEMKETLRTEVPPPSDDETEIERGLRLVAERTVENVRILTKYKAQKGEEKE